ncbi:YraN family protein [Alkaliflexus imshenetskii]|jgi:putative endonuclease|uniref:YraN family protein n=1 Tax=Alkaliflexus imshenetskii TaxID=286730 RepID=UPI00047D0F5B|nr:YraN family protein [Alkaliflexus imshenetskii]
MADHIELGKAGEEKACDFLVSKGFRIIARNWRFRQKEVDVIAYDGDVLVVVEVRTRTSTKWEHPRESITPAKIRFLVLATDAFVQQNRIDNRIRFDVVTCMPINETEWDIDHIQHAFTAQAE